jgi:hypothetical protein
MSRNVGAVKESGTAPAEFDRSKELDRKQAAAREMERRSALVDGLRGRSGGASSSSRRGAAVPLEDVAPEGQNFFLVNMAHHRLRPSSETPSIRVCGVFEDLELLLEHVKEVQGLLPDSDWWYFKRGEPFLICADREQVADLEYRKQKTDELFRLHGVLDAEEREKRWNEERRKRAPISKDKIGKSTLARLRKAKNSQKSARMAAIRAAIAKNCGNRRAKKFPPLATVLNQQSVVLSYLHDVTEPVLSGEKSPEPLVVLWAVFPDDQSAAAWVKDQGSRAVVDMVMDVMPMYDFPPFELVDQSKIAVTYRHGEHDAIMKGQQEEVAKIQRFRDHCKTENISAPETLIDVVEEEVRDAVTGKSTSKVVTKIQKPSTRMFDAHAQASSEPIVTCDQVRATEDQESDAGDRAAAQLVERAEKAWANLEDLSPEREFYAGDVDAEHLRLEAEKPRPVGQTFQPRVDPRTLRDPTPVLSDNVGLPGSVLVANSDGSGMPLVPQSVRTKASTAAPIFGAEHISLRGKPRKDQQ